MKKHSDTAPDGKNARLAEKYIKRGESEKYCKLLGDVLEGLDIKRRAVERTGIASFVSELEQVVLSSFEYGEISKIPCLVGTDRKKGSARQFQLLRHAPVFRLRPHFSVLVLVFGHRAICARRSGGGLLPRYRLRARRARNAPGRRKRRG